MCLHLRYVEPRGRGMWVTFHGSLCTHKLGSLGAVHDTVGESSTTMEFDAVLKVHAGSRRYSGRYLNDREVFILQKIIYYSTLWISLFVGVGLAASFLEKESMP